MDVYHARWIAPVDATPIFNGSLAVEDGRIVGVGVRGEPRPGSDSAEAGATRREHDFGDCCILPGFVNAHAHLELTCYRDALPRGPLWPWIERLIAMRLDGDADARERQAVRDGANESLAAGVTCVGDISRTGLNAEALRDLPIRGVCYVELISGARRPPNDPATLRSTKEGLRERCGSDRLRIGVSPHSLYTVTPEDMHAACSHAGLPGDLTVHFLETLEEKRWLEDGSGPVADLLAATGAPHAGRSSGADGSEVLDRAGVLETRPLLAHGNYATSRQIRRLAETQTSVAFCPRAHAYFGHADHPWREMLAAGVNVCVGTDSVAGNSPLSILDELRFLYSAADVSPDALLRMGTLAGADALGWGDEIGSLACGKRADFVVLPASPHATDPVQGLFDCAVSPESVWINGIQVYGR